MSERASLWGLRLLAVSGALALWFQASLAKREHVSERLVDAAVTYNAPRGAILLDPAQTVKVRLRGRDRRIGSLTPFAVSVIVDLTKSPFGRSSTNLSADNVLRPDELEVVSIEPTQIAIELDREATQLLAVRPLLVGEPAAGAEALAPRVIPDAVLVSGPESRLRRLSSVTTSPISLDGRALSFQQTASVVSPDSLIKIIEPTVVTVDVPMEEPTPAGDQRRRRSGSGV